MKNFEFTHENAAAGDWRDAPVVHHSGWILYWAHYFFIPGFMGKTGYPYLAGYLIAWPITMVMFFIATLVGYKLEGNALRWSSFALRFRLVNMTGRDWLWTLGLFLVSMALYFGLGSSSQ